MKRYPLILTFALYSSIAFIMMGIILSYVISEHIKEDKLTNVQEIIEYTVKSVTRTYLAKSNMEQVLPGAESDSIKSEIIDLLNNYSSVYVTLINKNGTVILSSDSTLTGNPTAPDLNVDNVLRGNSPHVISDTAGLLEGELDIVTYEPVTLNGKIEGVFVLKLSDQVIKGHVNSIIQVVVLALSGGLLLLFLLLVGILFRTSKSLFNQNEELISQKSEIETAYAKLDDSYISTMLTLSNAVDVRDPYTAGHSDRVTIIALLIASQLGLSEDSMKHLKYAALFHDIGKLGIPDSILLKNDKLTNEEYELIKRHPDIGVSILKNVEFLQNSLPIIQHHHERYSGNGYPDGLTKEEIPIGARVIAIADTYDAMTSDRPYRKGLGHDAAVQEIVKNKGTQFDDLLVDVFLKIENEIRDVR